ncbi:TadE/TadG family type IV pilus assembly protein [Sphingorhabdus sp. Alg239-R122]|uniref:TadE/TadG family type IV pilus assembly protein n=1 Tax=Sphingorhabdus sp. Alg239-R122 TaxID=2305989 RepID=UPI0013DB1B3C|nr:TadE/TadG family type IV pilus assembly protein [Sphingorhabdus sp. Alg239-R122]
MTHSKTEDEIRYRGALTTLLHDRRGNVLPMVAAGLLPLAAMIGGGVDTSRGYMTKTKLQQACDAGALAGRKTLDDPDRASQADAVAGNFFRANFPSDYMSTTDSQITRIAEDDGSFSDTEYKARATVTLPTAIMHMFGVDELQLSATCGAIYEVSNSDITMVLDVTGSMAWNSDGSQKSGVSTADQRITSLKNAMKNFYDTVDIAAQNSNARIRYAFVPYVQTVNVGRLLDQSWIADSHNYQSALRETITIPEETVEHYRSDYYVYTNDCSAYSGVWHGKRIYGRYEASSGDCVWDDIHAEYDTTQTTYSQRSLDTSVYKTFAGVADPTNRTSSTYTWAGCIEERETSPGASWSYNAINNRITSDSGATPWDLNIDDLPNGTDASKWKPYWPDITFYRNLNTTSSTSASYPQDNCPAAAQKLAVMTETQFDNYADGLSTGGGTYHDVGLLWGARLSSPDGIFSSNVRATPPNNGYVSRHFIFMTDGLNDNGNSLYGMYGIERHDGRVTGMSTSTSSSGIETAQEARSESRFLAICEAVKAKGIRLWVIAFGVGTAGDANGNGIPDTLDTCASADSAFASSSAAELNQNFDDIAENVAALRLAR